MSTIPNVQHLIPGAGPWLMSQTITAPAAPGNTGIHAAVTLPATGTTTVTTAITNPDVPRVVRIKGNASGIAGNVVVTGTDINGGAVTDTIALNGSSAVDGVKAFATVTSIVVPAKTNSSGDTVSVGNGAALGLSQLLTRNSVLRAFLNGTIEGTAPTVTFDGTNISGNTVLLNSSIPGSQNVIIDFYSTPS